ncbi:recombinase family protein [Vibrio owensii]|uniref:Resolvase n=1 Tax=Vibrio owensii CAIM 1854 = LMG 25443 TaxID=1229493 RepID=A0A0C1Z6Z0_9VIBR|nr:recombinase family protein [Vibrio owensii]KIF52760.1 resolvase [Vibrio owensii CAIM 1854 = LMG 25443]
MSEGRTFAYCRVSKSEQTTENQILAIKNFGYDIPDHRVISETVSGSVPAMERGHFKMLVEHKLEEGDKLVVLKLDRLGRDSIDVQHTISMLLEKGIRPISLDLPAADLSSAEGRLMLQMFSAFAEFERNRIRERTIEGQARARSEGKMIGRPEAKDTTLRVQECRALGFTQSKTAKKLDISLPTVKRHWNK